MTDLGDRFRTLDAVPRPNLWSEIETRAAMPRRQPANAFMVVLAAAMLLVVAIIGGALSFASRGTGGPVQSGRPGSSGSPSPIPSPHALGAWAATGDMHASRRGHTATLLRNGTVLVAGGLSDGVGLASSELYDPRNGSWSVTGSMVDGRGQHEATLLPDGRVLVIGGVSSYGGPGAEIELASAELYDPGTGAWTVTASMAEARAGGAVAVLPTGRVLVAGGWGSTERFGPKLATAELYDPGTGTWTGTETMTERRHGHGATLLPNGTVLVAGGYDINRSDSAELYNPFTGRWTITGSLPEPFLAYSAFLLPDGTVLVAGGDVPSGGGAVGSGHAARYDPVTGTWTTAAKMQIPRLSQAEVLLPDGSALVIGGRVNGGPASVTFASAELFDPARGTWTLVASLAVARSGHTATLLPDGRVLVVGGVGSRSDDALVSAELYEPGGGS